MARVPAAPRRGARGPRRGPPRAGVAQGRRSRPTPTSRSSIIGAGMSGLLAAHRLAAGRRAVRHHREERRRRRHVAARTRYPGCRVDNPNHNYSYSFAQRHDWPLHFSTQDVLLDYFRRCADAFGLREHIQFATEVRVGRRGRTPTGAGRSWCSDADGREETVDAERGHQRGRPAQPPAVPRHRRPRLVRGPDVPLRALGPRRRSARQARRGDRHRRERGAVHPRDRAATSASCSCSSARRRGSARPPTTTPPSRPACAGCTRTCRRTASGTASSSSGRWATACSRACASIPTGNRRTRRSGSFNDILRQLLTGYLGEQFADRPDLLDEGRADLPARREAAAARQRRVGGRAEARQRAADHRRRSARSRRPASSPPTASRTTSTSSSTAPASRRRSSSRR